VLWSGVVTEGAGEQQGREAGGMSARAVAWLAWIMWALSIGLTMLSLWLLILNLSHPNVPVYLYWAEDILLAVGYSTGGCGGLPQTRERGGLGVVLHWPIVGGGSFRQRVCHLRAAGSARVAPGC
jgi:hypothetical protein